jgi:hypothetical protein
MQTRICLMVVLKSLEIWISSTSFQKSNIGWPQQPPTEKVQIKVKIWVFDDQFHKKEVLVIWLPWSIQPSGAVIFLMKWGCKGHWCQGGCWGCRGHRGQKGSKVWKLLLRTSESYRFLNSALFWCFEKNNLVESWNIMLNFRTFTVGGCWGHSMLLFLTG